MTLVCCHRLRRPDQLGLMRTLEKGHWKVKLGAPGKCTESTFPSCFVYIGYIWPEMQLCMGRARAKDSHDVEQICNAEMFYLNIQEICWKPPSHLRSPYQSCFVTIKYWETKNQRMKKLADVCEYYLLLEIHPEKVVEYKLGNDPMKRAIWGLW